nr:hypothetical protein CFP56_33579 [Quercus suber]
MPMRGRCSLIVDPARIARSVEVCGITSAYADSAFCADPCPFWAFCESGKRLGSAGNESYINVVIGDRIADSAPAVPWYDDKHCRSPTQTHCQSLVANDELLDVTQDLDDEHPAEQVHISKSDKSLSLFGSSSCAAFPPAKTDPVRQPSPGSGKDVLRKYCTCSSYLVRQIGVHFTPSQAICSMIFLTLIGRLQANGGWKICRTVVGRSLRQHGLTLPSAPNSTISTINRYGGTYTFVALCRPCQVLMAVDSMVGVESSRFRALKVVLPYERESSRRAPHIRVYGIARPAGTDTDSTHLLSHAMSMTVSTP